MFKSSRSAILIALIYGIVGTVWVAASYSYVRASLSDEGQINLLFNQTLLRAFFILFSTGLLFFLVRGYTRKLENSAIQSLRLFEENPQPMYVFDQETLGFLTVNNAAIEKYGYSREEFMRMTIKDIRPKEEVARLLRDRKVLVSGFLSAGIWRHQTKTGKLLDVEISSHFIEYNGRKAELVFAHDVTERTKYENQILELNRTLEVRVNERTKDLHESLHEQAALMEELETYNEELTSTNEQLVHAQELIQRQARELVLSSEHKLNLVINNVKDFIWSARYRQGKFEVEIMSPAVANVLGFTPEEYHQNERIWFDVIHPEDRERNAGLIGTLGQDSYRELEYRVVHRKTREVRYVLSRIWANVTGEENVIQLNGIMTDITERRLQEEEKSRLIEQLVAHNNDLMQFSYIASHNLRGPVASILGIVQLARDTQSPEDIATLISHLNTSANKLDDVIKDLNKVLEIRDHQSLPKEWVNLQEVVENVKENLKDTIAKNNAHIDIDITAIPRVYTIKSYLHSIFYNLIGNSIKYRSPERDPVIKIIAEVTTTSAQVKFRDNGLGIDTEKYGNKLFSLYQRFHNHVEGKGLGLYLVRTQTTALGGRITLESKPDSGTEFTLTFPLHAIRPT